jgi:hypothetical protein
MTKFCMIWRILPGKRVGIDFEIDFDEELAKSGASLALEWPAELFPYAGVWITRGVWKGLHHWAIEPTNAPLDRLSDIHRLLGRITGHRHLCQLPRGNEIK